MSIEIVVPKGIAYPQLYVEAEIEEAPSAWLSSKDFAAATRKFPVVCTDVVLIDESDRFVLAHRRHACARGWWWMGGMLNANTTPARNIERILAREIGLGITSVTFLSQFFHQWSDTNERPGEPRLDLILLHFARVSEQSLEHVVLDDAEYDSSYKFMRYDGTQAVRPVVHDMFLKFKSR